MSERGGGFLQRGSKDSWKAAIYGVRKPLGPRAVHDESAGCEPLDERVPKRTLARGLVFQVLECERAGLAQSCDRSDIFCPRSDAALVSCAYEHGFERHAFRDEQSADALGRIQLVSGDREQRDAQSAHVHRDFADGLRGVDVHPRAPGARDFGDFADGLEHTGLVLRGDDAHEARPPIGEGSSHLGRGDDAVRGGFDEAERRA